MKPSLVAEDATRRLTSGRFETPALVILGAGFEERARALLRLLSARAFTLVAIVYRPGFRENRATELQVDHHEKVQRTAQVVRVECDPGQPRRFLDALATGLDGLAGLAEGAIWVDVSGLPMHVICMVLKVCRGRWPMREIRVVYSEAKEYFPTRKEYEGVSRRSALVDGGQLPRSLTSEMQENIIPEAFAGFAVKEAPTCLILQAGYEKHRSEGVVDHVNPHRLVLVYGRPARPSLQWRVFMARELHSSLLGSRPTSEEEVQTLDVGETMALLNRYYSMLFDNHNIVIAPVGGKLQTVGAYLIWERYRDIQLVYPLPVSYLPRRFSKGVGSTFWLQLPLLRESGVFGSKSDS